MFVNEQRYSFWFVILNNSRSHYAWPLVPPLTLLISCPQLPSDHKIDYSKRPSLFSRILWTYLRITRLFIPPAVHGAMSCCEKGFKLVWRCLQLPFRFLVSDHLPRVPYQSTNDKGDLEMIPRSVHRSLGIYLTNEKTPGKPQLGEPSATASLV